METALDPTEGVGSRGLTQVSPADRRTLGLSVWLLLLLQQWRDSSELFVRSGKSVRASELAEAMGVGERQARRELQRLRRAGYVDLQNTGRGYVIRLRHRVFDVGPAIPGERQ